MQTPSVPNIESLPTVDLAGHRNLVRLTLAVPIEAADGIVEALGTQGVYADATPAGDLAWIWAHPEHWGQAEVFVTGYMAGMRGLDA